MGVRGELYSTKVALQNRTYFFNVKENRLGDFYLNIVESKNRDEGGFERQSVILFADDLQEFLKGFDESLRVMEKAVREKRRGRSAGGDARPGRSSQPGFEADRDSGGNSGRDFGRDSGRDYPQGGRDYERGESPRRPRSPYSGRKSDGRSSRSGREAPAGRDTPRYRDGPRPKGPRAFGTERRDEGTGRSRSGPRDRDKEKYTPAKKKVVVRKK